LLKRLAIEANLASDKTLIMKKTKQQSDEAFNAGKEIEAMMRLTLQCFIASLFQLPNFALHEAVKA
jgi:hypothetical protein